MPWIAENPTQWVGQEVGTGQCAAYVQQACGVSHAPSWRRGILVRGGAVAQGTAIATFDPDGTYGSHEDGRSHAAVFEQEATDGLLVWDQWVGHPVAERTIHFRNGRGLAVDDGDQFYVIESA